MRKMKRMKRRTKVKRMRRKKKMMMNKLVLVQFFFLVYNAFNPSVHNSLFLKKKIEM